MVEEAGVVVVIDAEEYIVKGRRRFEDECEKIKEHAKGKAHVAHVVMVKESLPARSGALKVSDAKNLKGDRRLVSTFDDNKGLAFKKNGWNCARVNRFYKERTTDNEDLLDHLLDLYDNHNARIFEFVGFYGDCCVTSSAKGVRRYFKGHGKTEMDCRINLHYGKCLAGKWPGYIIVLLRTIGGLCGNLKVLPPCKRGGRS